jgi:ethanolamine ammonia-lyase large subunit
MQRLIPTTLCAVLLLAAASPAAHDRYRIVGTVTKLTADEITVKQIKDNTLVEMDHDKNTKVTRDNKRAKLSDVKVGSSVVIDALGDSILDLVVLEIKIVPAIPGTQKPK